MSLVGSSGDPFHPSPFLSLLCGACPGKMTQLILEPCLRNIFWRRGTISVIWLVLGLWASLANLPTRPPLLQILREKEFSILSVRAVWPLRDPLSSFLSRTLVLQPWVPIVVPVWTHSYSVRPASLCQGKWFTPTLLPEYTWLRVSSCWGPSSILHTIISIDISFPPYYHKFQVTHEET